MVNVAPLVSSLGGDSDARTASIRGLRWDVGKAAQGGEVDVLGGRRAVVFAAAILRRRAGRQLEGREAPLLR
ncbi:hypothetical protein [Streptomyces sp. NPDC101234]|uniref:hypothetical protein n=1 Tax=Streptomyces sp. NPDC101234 TaxID=3366138 RepID=UPI0037F6E3B1